MMVHKLRHGGGRAFRAAEEAERRGDPLDLPDFVREARSFKPQGPTPPPAVERRAEDPSADGASPSDGGSPPVERARGRRWLRSKSGVQS